MFTERSRGHVQALKTTVCRDTAVYTAIFGSCMAVYRVCTRREQPCTRAVNTPVYMTTMYQP